MYEEEIMEIQKKGSKIRVSYKDGSFIEDMSVNTVLLYAIVEKLEEIRMGLVDIENTANGY